MQYFLSLREDSGARVLSRVGARPESRVVARAQSRAGFTRKDYMQVFKTLSTATASRDLNAAVKSGVLERMGEGNQVRYRHS